MSIDIVRDPREVARLEVVVTSLSSDAHSWNLVYLELLLEEIGCHVVNLGPCIPDETIVRECATRHPDLVVISSLNGHALHDGMRLIRMIRNNPNLTHTPVVIGGNLDVAGGGDGRTAALLLEVGFDAVFQGAAAITAFRSLVNSLAAAPVAEIGAP